MECSESSIDHFRFQIIAHLFLCFDATTERSQNDKYQEWPLMMFARRRGGRNFSCVTALALSPLWPFRANVIVFKASTIALKKNGYFSNFEVGVGVYSWLTLLVQEFIFI